MAVPEDHIPPERRFRVDHYHHGPPHEPPEPPEEGRRRFAPYVAGASCGALGIVIGGMAGATVASIFQNYGMPSWIVVALPIAGAIFGGAWAGISAYRHFDR